jgi:hypothetical protein
VELLSWKSKKDILGDGGVMKTILQEGTGWDNPKDRDEVLGACVHMFVGMRDINENVKVVEVSVPCCIPFYMTRTRIRT